MTDEFELPLALQSLDRTLRCNICKELFSIPVSLKCGHCFCSECIRSHMAYAQKHQFEISCPDCRQPAQEGDIRKVLIIAAAVREYKGVRPRLVDRVSSHSFSPSPPQDEENVVLESKEQIKVPPILHKGLTTANQLREKLRDLGLPTDGNKGRLWSRYQSFRRLIGIENDRGSQLTLSEIVQKFIKRENCGDNVERGYFLRSLDGDENFNIQKKTHSDLIGEVKERKRI